MHITTVSYTPARTRGTSATSTPQAPVWRTLCALLALLLLSAAGHAQDITASVEQPTAAATPETSTLTVPVERTVVVAPRTNLLLPLLNVGLEVPIGNRWSVGADWYYPWLFRKADHKNCFQIDGLSLEGRLWLGARHKAGAENRKHRLRGHSIGLFAMAGRYDLERNYEGHQGEYVLGGVDYLFAMPVCRGHLHLEFALGVGYFYSRATHYEVNPDDRRGYRDKDYRKIFQYFGPLKANVTLVVPLKRKVNKEK